MSLPLRHPATDPTPQVQGRVGVVLALSTGVARQGGVALLALQHLRDAEVKSPAWHGGSGGPC